MSCSRYDFLFHYDPPSFCIRVRFRRMISYLEDRLVARRLTVNSYSPPHSFDIYPYFFFLNPGGIAFSFHALSFAFYLFFSVISIQFSSAPDDRRAPQLSLRKRFRIKCSLAFALPSRVPLPPSLTDQTPGQSNCSWFLSDAARMLSTFRCSSLLSYIFPFSNFWFLLNRPFFRRT